MVIALLASISPSSATTTTYTKSYAGSNYSASVFGCPSDDGGVPSSGGVCFPVSGEDYVDVSINDAYAFSTLVPYQPGQIEGSWAFWPVPTYDENGIAYTRPLATGEFCGSGNNIPVPAGSATLTVSVEVPTGSYAATTPESLRWVWGIDHPTSFCTLSPPTKGTITATFGTAS